MARNIGKIPKPTIPASVRFDNAKLLVDGSQVGLHRTHAEVEVRGDLAIPLPPAEERQDVQFPGRQVRAGTHDCSSDDGLMLGGRLYESFGRYCE